MIDDYALNGINYDMFSIKILFEFIQPKPLPKMPRLGPEREVVGIPSLPIG